MVNRISLRQDRDPPISQALGRSYHLLAINLLKLVKSPVLTLASQVAVWSTSKVTVKWVNMANTLLRIRLMVSKDRCTSSVSHGCIVSDLAVDANFERRQCQLPELTISMFQHPVVIALPTLTLKDTQVGVEDLIRTRNGHESWSWIELEVTSFPAEIARWTTCGRCQEERQLTA